MAGGINKLITTARPLRNGRSTTRVLTDPSREIKNATFLHMAMSEGHTTHRNHGAGSHVGGAGHENISILPLLLPQSTDLSAGIAIENGVRHSSDQLSMPTSDLIQNELQGLLQSASQTQAKPYGLKRSSKIYNDANATGIAIVTTVPATLQKQERLFPTVAARVALRVRERVIAAVIAIAEAML